MLGQTKTLSLVEQKKLQWAKEREEMMGLYGLWGRPRNFGTPSEPDQVTYYRRNSLLPPIPGKGNEESGKEFRPEEESETSGYLSDSPKRLRRSESAQDYQHFAKAGGVVGFDNADDASDVVDGRRSHWSECNATRPIGQCWADKKSYKNYRNETWTNQSNGFSSESDQGKFTRTRNQWQRTPDSVSSDDGCRLRWGDRGVGIGHLWDPVINQPDCRLPLVTDQYRPTPKWVEKGLRDCDGNRSEVLIISHPDDEPSEFSGQKNFILGQNAPIPPEVIEERERKRKKALEHQNAIKKQLEERELKRKQERERRIREEKLEEERIKKEQEIERLRYEEEQRKLKEKEELEKRREETMKEAIEMAEKRAREDKKRSKRQVQPDESISPKKEKFGQPERNVQPTEATSVQRKPTRKYKKTEVAAAATAEKQKREQTISEKVLRDSSSQFEEIQLANSFQLLNMNGVPVPVPVDGGLALMLDNTPKDSSGFLLPAEGVQLALLMSPRNAGTTNRLIPLSPPTTDSVVSAERTLTPSKYRLNHRLHRTTPSNKSTQTDFRHSSTSVWTGSAGKRRRLSLRCGPKTSGNGAGTSQKSGNSEKHHHKHSRCFVSAKYRSKALPPRLSLEDRPKWGINRPSVQYMKQSEKDPYYQKRLREKLKNANGDAGLSSSDQTIKNEEESERLTERELSSVVQMLELPPEPDEKADEDDDKPETVLRNGFRMNSNLSSPVFVPIDNRVNPDWDDTSKRCPEIESEKSFDSLRFAARDDEDTTETEQEKTTEAPGSTAFLTNLQLEAIQKISNLREALINLQKDYSNSRSVTPFSEKSDK